MSTTLKVLVFVTAALLAYLEINNGDAEARRLAARWDALVLTKQAQDNGAVLASRPGGVFIGIDALNRSASLIVGSKAVLNSGSGLLNGATVTIRNIALRSDVGQILARVEAEGVAADGVVRVTMGIDASVRYMGTTLLKDGRGAAVFRMEPYAVYGSGAFLVNLFSFGERAAFAKDLANIILNNVDESLLEIRTVVPVDLAVDLTLDSKSTETSDDGKGSYVIESSAPKSALRTSLSLGAFVACKGGVLLLADTFNPRPPLNSNYRYPPVSNEMKPVLDQLIRINSPLAQTELPRSIAKLSELVDALTTTVQPSYGQKLPADADVVLFLRGDTISGLISGFHNLSADQRTVSLQVENIAGHLGENPWSDNVLGNGGLFLDLRGGSGTVGLDLSNPIWSGDGLSAELSFDISLAANANLQVIPFIGGGVGLDMGFTGHTAGRLPLTVHPTILTKGDASEAALEVDIGEDNVVQDLTTDRAFPLVFPGGWAVLPKLGVRLHQPLLSNQPAPLKLFDNETVLADEAPPDTGNSDWSITLPFGTLVERFQPIVCKATTDGLVLAANVGLSTQRDRLGSPAGQAYASKVDQENKPLQQLLADASQDSISRRTHPGPRELEVLLGNIAIGKNNDLLKLLEWAYESGKAVLTPLAKASIPVIIADEQATAEAQKVFDNAKIGIEQTRNAAIDAANKVADAAKKVAQAAKDFALKGLGAVNYVPDLGSVDPRKAIDKTFDDAINAATDQLNHAIANAAAVATASIQLAEQPLIARQQAENAAKDAFYKL